MPPRFYSPNNPEQLDIFRELKYLDPHYIGLVNYCSLLGIATTSTAVRMQQTAYRRIPTLAHLGTYNVEKDEFVLESRRTHQAKKVLSFEPILTRDFFAETCLAPTSPIPVCVSGTFSGVWYESYFDLLSVTEHIQLQRVMRNGTTPLDPVTYYSSNNLDYYPIVDYYLLPNFDYKQQLSEWGV